MPAADELFRSTAGGAALLQTSRPEEPAPRIRVTPPPAAEQAPPAAPAAEPARAIPAQAPAVEPTRSVAAFRPELAVRTAIAPSVEVSARPAPAPAPEPAPTPTAQTQAPAPTRRAAASAPRRPSGRERHDEKITVYVSPDELLGLEHARITLRGEYGVAVDRGRIVREAVAALLADLDARGPDSILVKRLSNGS